MNVSHSVIITEAQNFLLTNYNIELDIPIEYNHRLRRTLGRFISTRIKDSNKNKPKKIELSTELMQQYTPEIIIDVLKHELVHYALCAKGHPRSEFRDGHIVFEKELRRLGVAKTRTYSNKNKVKHKYVCDMCGKEHKLNSKVKFWVQCNCSINSKLIYEGIVEDKLANLTVNIADYLNRTIINN